MTRQKFRRMCSSPETMAHITDGMLMVRDDRYYHVWRDGDGTAIVIPRWYSTRPRLFSNLDMAIRFLHDDFGRLMK